MKLRLAYKRNWLELPLAIALGLLCLQIFLSRKPARSTSSEMVLHAEQGQADMALRNADFPRTFVGSIRVDLTSPKHEVRLIWSGPESAAQPTGPFHSSPGKGSGDNNCDAWEESNRGGSKCTPKGTRLVEGFSDYMPSTHLCRFVTWFHTSREIAFHSHVDVPTYPASNGCVRLDEFAAQLIHNNSLVGRTQVIVGGTWTKAPNE
jgi:L,D-transpeptidase catalytic domain